MPIQHTCGCGARIKLPDSAAGRKARCKACGGIFKVPGLPAPGSAKAAAAVPSPSASHKDATPDDWLLEFADTESKAEGEPVRLLDLSPAPGDEPEPASPARHSEPVREDRDWVVSPRRSFWADLATSFILFLDGGNMIMFIVVVLISIWSTLVSYAPVIGLLGQMILSGYLCAFYMNTILETASGEDELPGVSISSSAEDLFMPLIRFIGTWVVVLLPAFVAMMMTFRGCGMFGNPEANWPLVWGLALVGLIVWPVVVLGVAIGGTLRGMLPHTAVRTILSAPIPYLAILIVLAVAAAIRIIVPILPYLLGVNQTMGTIIGSAIFGMAASAYSMIVAMRVIGLFYRHYKHRFPWTAE